MELYRRFPVLCTIWAFLEVVCFGGVIFGWGSLVFILKEEGFYSELCTYGLPYSSESHSNLTEVHLGVRQPIAVVKLPRKSNVSVYDTDTANMTSVEMGEKENEVIGSDQNFDTPETECQEQAAKLNLWFSVAVSFMYLSFAGVGFVTKKLGTRLTRCAFIVVYVVGALCIAFATPDIPWLLLPGLCCIGIAGLGTLATNLQVADLHPHIRSIIVAIFTGLFDFSTILQQVVKIAYENGIQRRTSYIFIAVAYTVLVSVSTLFFLPRKRITEEHVEERRRSRRRSSMKNMNDVTKEMLEKRANIQCNNNENLLQNANETDNGEKGAITFAKEKKVTLLSSLLSFTCILHLCWLFVHVLRFVTFIGLLNQWLLEILEDSGKGNMEKEEKVGGLLGVFSYVTLGAVVSALICGSVYDWQRNRLIGAGKLKRTYTAVVLPMSLVIFYSVSVTVLCYLKNNVTIYLAFIMFTFFRSSLFTVAISFLGEAFPISHFGVLFGFVQFAAGLAGLLQYPLFQWSGAYHGSFDHVNILLLCLQVATIIHPVILYIRGSRDHSTEGSFTLEYEFQPTTEVLHLTQGKSEPEI